MDFTPLAPKASASANFATPAFKLAILQPTESGLLACSIAHFAVRPEGFGHELLSLLVQRPPKAKVLATPTQRQALAPLVLYTASVFRIPPHATKQNHPMLPHRVHLFLCVGRDSNPRRPKPPDLQSGAIDHSATYAIRSLLRPNYHNI